MRLTVRLNGARLERGDAPDSIDPHAGKKRKR